MTYPKAITKRYLLKELKRLKERKECSLYFSEIQSLEGSILTIRKLLDVLKVNHS